MGWAVASWCRSSGSMERGLVRCMDGAAHWDSGRADVQKEGAQGSGWLLHGMPPTGLKHSHCLTVGTSESGSGCRQGQLPLWHLGGSLRPLPALGGPTSSSDPHIPQGSCIPQWSPHSPVAPTSPGGPGIPWGSPHLPRVLAFPCGHGIPPGGPSIPWGSQHLLGVSASLVSTHCHMTFSPCVPALWLFS